MINETDYKKYFGVTTAPTNLARLEFISLQIFKSIITSTIPVETDSCYEGFLNALMEQINFINENMDMFIYKDDGGFTIGKYSSNGSQDIKTNQAKEKISPIAYDILLNCGLLYSGLC